MPQPFDPKTLPLRWRDEDAAVALDAWRASGLSLVAFARRHGLKAKRLYRWHDKMRQAELALPRLVEVQLPRPVERQIEPFTVEFPGVRLQVPPVFDAEAPSDLVAVVRC